MCRIAGIVDHSVSPENLSIFIKGMCCSLAHGGPDDEGIYQNDARHLAIGHRRLSIIDISNTGHQPMFYGQGRYVISYNGELYNYKELKKELTGTGAVFATQSDTEVILAAYAAWGVDAFKRFSGMFAFAIWDNRQEELIIARDAGGIKPLYYAYTKNGFAFASEVRAFRNIPYLQQPNPHWQVYLMAYGHLPEPVTLLKDVKPLEKGTYLVYRPLAHTLTVKSFFRYTYLEKEDNRKRAIAAVKEGLQKAVTKHLIADAPIGVFLSGGLDSSVIATLADKEKAGLQAVSVYFNNRQYSEKRYQDVLKKQLSSGNHHQFIIDANDFHYHLPAIIKSMDLPCCDGINTWFISKYARESGLKAVLSGIGGDELFGGYPSFKRIKTALALQSLPGFMLRSGSHAGSKRIKRLSYLSIKGAVGRYLFLRGQFIPGDIAKVLNAEEAEVWNVLSEQPRLPSIDHLSATNQASWLETNLYMQNQLLRDADVMSMAHGLEIRVPFLDKEFVETVFKIKSGIKYSGKLGKQLLIDSFIDVMPKAIWNRRKMGFAFPFREWLTDERYAESANGKVIEDYHQKLQNGEMHWSQFFTLLLLNRHDAA